jgi:hypothetical protein
MRSSSEYSLYLAFELGPLSVDQAFSCVDNDLVSVGKVRPVAPDRLAKPPLHSIPYDRPTDGARHGEADLARLIRLRITDESRKKGAGHSRTFFVDSLELGSLAKAPELGESLGTRKTGCSDATVPS